MLTIFVSHAWSENEVYANFVELLDQAVGPTRWKNVSIPSNDAIDFVAAQQLRHQSKISKLEDDLLVARAKYNDPKLRDAKSLSVWRDGKLVELPTRLTVANEIEKIQKDLNYYDKREGFISEIRNRRTDLSGAKGVSALIHTYPELSIAIRDRLISANVVILLITSLVRLHPWVEHEIRLCFELHLPIIGVRANSEDASRENEVDCDSVVAWDHEEIRSQLSRFDSTL